MGGGAPNAVATALRWGSANGADRITVSIQSSPEGGVPERQAEDVKTALRGLGLNDSVDVE
jgi:hypothetical protein